MTAPHAGRATTGDASRGSAGGWCSLPRPDSQPQCSLDGRSRPSGSPRSAGSLRRLFGSKAMRDRETARTEAIAAWTEMLRDTITGAHGLEEAIMTSAAVAPEPLRREVVDLAVRLERQPLTGSLEAFAEDLAHPTADLVVAALRLASEGAVGDLAELLGTLAVSARDEAGMRLRVEAARARLRTAVRVITGCTLATALGLLLLNRPYLAFYGTPAGQAVLAVVAGLWAASLVWLGRMADFVTPERFLATRTTEPAA